MVKNNVAFDLLRMWQKKHFKYETFKKSENRSKSVYFGVQSIIESVIGLVLIGLCIWGIIALASSLSLELGFLQILGMVILAALILSFLIYCPIQSLVCLIYQLLLNKKAVGWVALAIWIFSIIAYCVEIVLLIFYIL